VTFPQDDALADIWLGFVCGPFGRIGCAIGCGVRHSTLETPVRMLLTQLLHALQESFARVWRAIPVQRILAEFLRASARQTVLR
jgi:hypothetical protein